MAKGSVLVVGMRVALVLIVGAVTLIKLGTTEDRILKGRRSGGYYTVSPTTDSSSRLNNPPISTIVTTPVPVATTIVSNGEYCNEARGLICNSKALLKCFRARCVCSKPDDMIFDTVKGQCVAKAGAKCTFEPSEGFKSLPCVRNAICNNAGICECSPRFYNSLNVTCIPQKSFDAYCHFDKECREAHHLRCISGRCRCDPAVSIKHRKYELCLGLAGEAALDGNCIEFTERVSLNPRSPVKCECQNGYLRSIDKKCHGGFGQACTVDSPCQQIFSCIQGVCHCPAHSYQSYDEDKERCRSNAFGPCSQSSECITQAFCNTSGVYSRCECREGYIVGVSRNCEKSVGMPCQMYPHSGAVVVTNNETLLDECSASVGLVCTNGFCACPAMRIYSENFEKCVGLVDSICVLGQEPEPICTENSECAYKFERLGFGHCKCREGFRMTRDRRCAQITVKPATKKRKNDNDDDDGVPRNTTSNEIMDTISTTTTATTTTSRTTPVPTIRVHTPLIPANVDVEKLRNDTKNKHLWEFFVFLNDTLHGNFNNASFKKFMKKDWFRLPD